MIRTSLPAPLAALCLAAFASAALADEYTVEAFDGGFVTPPEPVSTLNPNGSTQIVGHKVDAAMVTVSLPFQFPFFGALRDKIRVSADGWIAFGTASIVEAENPALPVGTKREALVAPLWDDLRTTGKGSVVTFTLGTSPNRRFVVAWQGMDTASRAGGDPIAFEVLLHETSGEVEIVYRAEGDWKGLSYTAGIEDDSGKRAFGGPGLGNDNDGRPEHDQRFVPNAIPVSGTITRDRPVASSGGLGPATAPNLPVLPVAGVEVALTREDDGRTVATGRTLDDGTFTVTALGIDGVPGLAVELLAAGVESRVTDTNGATWKRRIATGVVPDVTGGPPTIGTIHLGADVDVTDPNFRKALNIQQAARKGYAFALAASATATLSTKTFPQLEIRWVQGSATASGYAAATGSTPARATISDAPANPDAYDDDMVLCEYGQHVLATIAAFPATPAPHQWANVLTNESVAFVDGFSFWFAAAVLGRPQFIDTTSASTANTFDLETPALAVTGPAVPGAVAGSLWDLVDPANEPFDGLAGALPAQGHEVLLTLDQKRGAASLPSTAVAWTMSPFFDAWSANRDAAVSAATCRAFIHAGTLVDDSFEANDLAGEQKAFTAPSRKQTGLVLNRFNEDRFSFGVAANPVSVTVTFPEAAIVEVSVLDSGGNVKVSSTNAATETSVVVVVPGVATPETHVVRVLWKSGPAAHYTLSIFDDIALVTTALPPWTVGEPFNFDVVVTGGLAPLKVTLDPAIPGLSFGSTGTHLSGRPEVAGTQDVDVLVDDASGAGPRVAGTLHVVVNPAFVLPDHFGVPAARTIAVDVGSGGTSPAWTVGALLPPAGFTLTGGATLRLAGTTGSPGTFDVSGSGSDAAGASVTAKTCHVVVCAPVADAGRTNVTAGAPFGFYFDAIEGSRASFDFAFSGSGTLPQLVVLDAAGAALDAASAIRTGGGHVRVSNLAVPLSGRYFLVFRPGGSSKFTGSVSPVRSKIRPATRITGVSDISTPAKRVEIRFHALAGSRLKVVLRSGEAPVAAKPDFIEVTTPSGATLPLPPGKTGSDGRRKTVSGIALDAEGEYLVRVGGDDATTGPLNYTLEISPPNGAPYKVD